MSKLAAKRLTASDLTFFEWHFRNHPAGKQKSINLNADVLVGKLYPGLPEVARENDGKILLDLYIYGPGLKGPFNLPRKIIKRKAYKNWRLDGEFVDNPSDDPDRFNVLKPGDIVVFEFEEDTIPHTVRAVFVAREIREDGALHARLDELLSEHSMVSLTVQELSQAVQAADLDEEHPIRQLMLDVSINRDLEDAVLGGSMGAQRLLRDMRRRVPAAKMRLARQQIEEVGQLGEELVDAYLLRLKKAGCIRDYEWVSRDNAIAPYDFLVQESDSSETFIDVKTTEKEFDRTIHLSTNELKQIQAVPRYRIYRVYAIEGSRAALRISGDLNELAENVLSVSQQLPEGVAIDGISLSPSRLKFGDEIEIRVTDDEDDWEQ